MAFGVSLWFDSAFEQTIRGVWGAVRDEGVAAKLADGAYRPHVTLGIWGRLAQPEAQAALVRTAADRPAVALRFDAFGAFSGPEPGLFLTPTVTARLRELHESVHAALAACTDAPVGYHLPEAWNPHCTLAWGLSAERLPAALAVALRELHLPVTATADRIGLVDTPAEVELACFPLAAG